MSDRNHDYRRNVPRRSSRDRVPRQRYENESSLNRFSRQAALTAAVTLSHSAVRRARSCDTAERLRLIAMALPPDW